MPRLLKALILLVLLILIAALITAMAVEWPERVYTPSAAPPASSAAGLEAEAVQDPAPLLNPADIAKVFGYVKPVVVRKAPEPVPVIVPPVATWISSIGSVTSADGDQRYVLKITRPRETIISLGIGEIENGILLVALEGKNLVIEREEERYLVPLPGR